MPRLFVAIDAPAEVREQLASLQREQKGVKWVPKEQLHFTLRFIGDFDDVEAIKAALAQVSASPFSLAIAGTGQFPPKRAARVIWAGIAPVQEITALAAQIDKQVIAAGIAPEERAYSPHLTLARIKDAPLSFARAFLEAHHGIASEPFRVDRFHLYASELSPKGAKHTVLESFALADR